MTSIERIRKPHSSPGRLSMNSSTIQSPPVYVNTIEKAVAPIRIAKTIAVILTVSSELSQTMRIENRP